MMSTMKKTLWISTVVIVLGLVAWGIAAAVRSSAPQGPDYSTFYPAQSHEHIQPGSEHPAYNSNPPSAGWHYPVTAKKQYYSEPIPDEYAIHNLEHGDIWITFNPRVSQKVKDGLKDFAFSKIFISPRATTTTDIALVAWEHVDGFNLEGDALPEWRIRDFIKRYRGKGPENIPVGAMEQTFN